ncbi:peptide/nickel transport system permease protein [Nocardioides thalensis]|uniref:Peptide/nickel transport system permease protein n=1 Tax=Nocardioides thalensis TaxID=1914755 RepID=A0A853C4G6_9ACTN|nr:ABC transporter permease [Nocardioides thalensis]NYJ01582.1 peptide/nickel transport system permease protein [Nocardioides thalensis]
MFSFLVKRILSGSLIIVLVSMIVYTLFFFGPESPALELCRRDTNNRCGPDSAKLVEYEDRLGYNNPVHEEYGKWAKGLVAGRDIHVGQTVYECPAPCLGLSYRDRSLVTDQMKKRFPVTLSLAIGASFLYLAIGVTVGVLAARRRGTFADKALVSSTLVLSSIPYYLVALMSFLFLTLDTSVFPDVGYTPFFDNPAKWATGLLLVWLVMGLYGATSYTRYSRGAMVESLNEDYVRTAKAKGLKARSVVAKHALRSALVPVVTIFGLDVAFLMSGTVFTEQIFSLEGIGKWGVDAVNIMDLPVVQATSLVLAIFVVISTMVVDILYSVLDPRVRLS